MSSFPLSACHHCHCHRPTWCGPDSSENRWSPSRCRIASTIVSRFCFPAPVSHRFRLCHNVFALFDLNTSIDWKTHWCCHTSESQCIAVSLQSQDPLNKNVKTCQSQGSSNTITNTNRNPNTNLHVCNLDSLWLLVRKLWNPLNFNSAAVVLLKHKCLQSLKIQITANKYKYNYKV